ncbi:exonuclease 1-like [Patiria miniata]|uniref:Exonuclease 1 n=1 Tax=Patiria miniata TaxID=46514 RepID=A0A914BG32_PATMI|nr:exonuclease 1-like [Patiria miniata]XP_038075219.1 exonuclease 1-like [Patiria miniata]
MGIQGLLPFLKDATHRVNVRKYSGYTVAVDTYCWIHRGAFGCAMQLAKGEETDMYVRYCLKFINMLRSMDIRPILVFDGSHLPAKKSVEESRRERRELYSKKGKQFLREGKVSEARDCFSKCINVTPRMALEVIKAARSLGVDCIVAPYEADAQLAYLAISGMAQAVITEDSDLVAFGCPRIIYKLDLNGNGLEIVSSRLNQAMKIGDRFSLDKFRYMCIASGCDYLASLPGIGLGKAKKLFQNATNPDITHVLKRLPIHLKMKVTVPPEYIEGFLRANNTFLYQLAFDPVKRRLVPVHPYSAELDKESLTYAGPYCSSELALQQALGNIDPNTKNKIFDFQPERNKPYDKSNPRHRLSIWHKDYRPGPDFSEGDPAEVQRPKTQGKEVTLMVNGLKLDGQQRKRPRPDADEDDPSNEDLTSLYGSPKSKRHLADPNLVVPETPEDEDKVPGKTGPRNRNPFSKEGRLRDSPPKSAVGFGSEERVVKTLSRRNIFAKGRTGGSSRLDLLKSSTVVTSRFFATEPNPVLHEMAQADESDPERDCKLLDSQAPSVTDTSENETNEDDGTSGAETMQNGNVQIEKGSKASTLNKLQRFQRATSAPVLPFTCSAPTLSSEETAKEPHLSGSQDFFTKSQELDVESHQVGSQESSQTSVKAFTKKGVFSWSRKTTSVTSLKEGGRARSFRSLKEFKRQTVTAKLERSDSKGQEGATDFDSSQEGWSQESCSVSLESQQSNLCSIDTDSLSLSQFSSQPHNNSKTCGMGETNSSQINSFQSQDQDDVVEETLGPRESEEPNNNCSPLRGIEEHLMRINNGQSHEEVLPNQTSDSDKDIDILDSVMDVDSDSQDPKVQHRGTVDPSKLSEPTSKIGAKRGKMASSLDEKEEFIDLTSESDENTPPLEKTKRNTSTGKMKKMKSNSDLEDTPTLPVFPKLPGSTKLNGQCKASGLSRRQKSKQTPKADENRGGGTRQQTLFAFMKKSSERRKDANPTAPLSPSKQNIICDETPEGDSSLCSKGIVRLQRNIFK